MMPASRGLGRSLLLLCLISCTMRVVAEEGQEPDGVKDRRANPAKTRLQDYLNADDAYLSGRLALKIESTLALPNRVLEDLPRDDQKQLPPHVSVAPSGYVLFDESAEFLQTAGGQWEARVPVIGYRLVDGVFVSQPALRICRDAPALLIVHEDARVFEIDERALNFQTRENLPQSLRVLLEALQLCAILKDLLADEAASVEQTRVPSQAGEVASWSISLSTAGGAALTEDVALATKVDIETRALPEPTFLKSIVIWGKPRGDEARLRQISIDDEKTRPGFTIKSTWFDLADPARPQFWSEVRLIESRDQELHAQFLEGSLEKAVAALLAQGYLQGSTGSRGQR